MSPTTYEWINSVHGGHGMTRSGSKIVEPLHGDDILAVVHDDDDGVVVDELEHELELELLGELGISLLCERYVVGQLAP